MPQEQGKYLLYDQQGNYIMSVVDMGPDEIEAWPGRIEYQTIAPRVVIKKGPIE